MFNKCIIFLLMVFSYSFAQTYCAGDQVSETHQNQAHVVGAPIEGYEEGGEFRLADWNGTLNGGQYHVIFIDMSASW